jgi:hypothetical protein
MALGVCRANILGILQENCIGLNNNFNKPLAFIYGVFMAEEPINPMTPNLGGTPEGQIPGTETPETIQGEDGNPAGTPPEEKFSFAGIEANSIDELSTMVQQSLAEKDARIAELEMRFGGGQFPNPDDMRFGNQFQRNRNERVSSGSPHTEDNQQLGQALYNAISQLPDPVADREGFNRGLTGLLLNSVIGHLNNEMTSQIGSINGEYMFQMVDRDSRRLEAEFEKANGKQRLRQVQAFLIQQGLVPHPQQIPGGRILYVDHSWQFNSGLLEYANRVLPGYKDATLKTLLEKTKQAQKGGHPKGGGAGNIPVKDAKYFAKALEDSKNNPAEFDKVKKELFQILK